MRRFAIVLATLAAMAAFAADPNQNRGFADQVFHSGDIDHVNVFNGNVVIRIPIGQAYKVGPLLQYQLVLTYNSKIWDYRQENHDCSKEPPGCQLRYGVPEKTSTAGFGWTLSLGRLILPTPCASTTEQIHGWIYVGPDGGHHELKQVLVPDPSTHPCHQSVTRARTTDTSYLELRRDNLARPEIWFPDGHVKVFDEAGRLVEMRDRHGNWVKIGYSTTQWVIEDGFGAVTARKHYVNLLDKSGLYTEPNFQYVVSSVELQAPDQTPENTTDTNERAVFSFTYADRWIGRGGNGERVGALPSRCVKAPLLENVTLPDATSYSAAYKFVPDKIPGQTGWPCDLPEDDLYSVLDGDYGVIRSLELPAGGSIEWVHGTYPMNVQQCDHIDGFESSYVGVTKRIFKKTDGSPVTTWTYTPQLVPRPGNVNQTCNGTRVVDINLPAEEFVNDLETSSAGKKLRTRNYFSVFPRGAIQEPQGGSPNGFQWQDYGLPFTRRDPIVETGRLRLLSTETQDCTTACDTRQETYVLYERDEAHEPESNPRVVADRVVHREDAGCNGSPCYTDTQRAEWDGYGHYRKTVQTSNFPGSLDRTTYVNYAPDATRWLLEKYTDSWVVQGSGANATATKTLSVFDDTLGVLKSQRTLRATGSDPALLAISNGDLLTVYCRDASSAGTRGFVTSERSFGGRAGIPAGDLCSATRTDGHYFVEHSYTFDGAILTKHTAQYAGTSHFVADEDFDPYTGLVKARRDSAGVETKYRYDESGRLTLVKPAGQASTTYDFQLTSNPPALIIRQCSAGADSCSASSLAEERYYFDGFGRVIEEKRRMPGAQWSAVWNTYDPFGRPESKTVPLFRSSGSAETPVATAKTTWEYDVLGRVVKETRPDSSSSSFAYSGTRETTRSVADPGGSAKVRSTEQYDGKGRLIAVIQPSGPTSATTTTGANVTTEYAYDSADRLTSVRMNTEATPQTRTFTYDGAGLLLQESHPESGVTTYADYDARGHAGKRLPAGGHSLFKHRYTYDAAERLVQVDTGSPGWSPGATHVAEFRPEKMFTYAFVNEGDSRKAGKLEQAIRINYAACTAEYCVGGARVEVLEDYRYDSAGRKSGRTTVISDLTETEPKLLQSIDQEFSYNDLGLPAAIHYPTCSRCGVPPVNGPARNVGLTYSNGLLQNVAGYVSGVTYGAGGMPTGITHQNGVSDSVTLDSSGRPASYSFGAWSSCGETVKIDVQPAPQTIPSGSTATLEVTASGSSPTYQWYEAGYYDAGGVYHPDAAISGATQRRYTTPALSANKTYFVRVSNACNSVDSSKVTVTVTCAAPAITAHPQSRTVAAGTAVPLTVTATGTNLSYQWYRGATGNVSEPVGTNAPSYTTPALTATTSYWVRVTGACGQANSAAATLTVPLPTPAALLAQMETSTSVRLTWQPVSGAARYEVWRRSGGAFALVGTAPGSPWIDTGRTAGLTYVYRIRAVDANGGSASAFSNLDLATLVSYTSITAARTTIEAAHWNELHGALNSLRAANGDPTLTWAAILPADVPAPAPGVVVRAAHLEALRQQFATALQALGVAAPPYTNPDLVTEPLIRAVHVTELQQRMQ